MATYPRSRTGKISASPAAMMVPLPAATGVLTASDTNAFGIKGDAPWNISLNALFYNYVLHAVLYSTIMVVFAVFTKSSMSSDFYMRFQYVRLPFVVAPGEYEHNGQVVLGSAQYNASWTTMSMSISWCVLFGVIAGSYIVSAIYLARSRYSTVASERLIVGDAGETQPDWDNNYAATDPLFTAISMMSLPLLFAQSLYFMQCPLEVAALGVSSQVVAFLGFTLMGSILYDWVHGILIKGMDAEDAEWQGVTDVLNGLTGRGNVKTAVIMVGWVMPTYFWASIVVSLSTPLFFMQHPTGMITSAVTVVDPHVLAIYGTQLTFICGYYLSYIMTTAVPLVNIAVYRGKDMSGSGGYTTHSVAHFLAHISLCATLAISAVCMAVEFNKWHQIPGA
jgi:hypothetical protein